MTTDAARDIGPVEYILIGFPSNQFTGQIVPALGQLVDSGTVTIIDLVFLSKDEDGNLTSFEYDAADDFVAFAELPGEAGALLGEDDIAQAAAQLAPGSSAALIVWEDTWARSLAVAVRDAGGQILAGERIPHEFVSAALSELDAEEGSNA